MSLVTVTVSASSIPQRTDFHDAPWNSPFAAEKHGIACFFPTFISNLRFFRLFFLILSFIQQNLVVVSYGSVL